MFPLFPDFFPDFPLISRIFLQIFHYQGGTLPLLYNLVAMPLSKKYGGTITLLPYVTFKTKAATIIVLHSRQKETLIPFLTSMNGTKHHMQHIPKIMKRLSMHVIKAGLKMLKDAQT